MINNTQQKILIVYATRFGSTQGVAEEIGNRLRSSGRVVEICHIDHVSNIKSYDAAIIGSAIQYDTWLPEAAAFVREHSDMLSKIPVAYFFTCLTLSKRGKAQEKQAQGYAEKLIDLAPAVKPVAVGRFAGVLDYKRFSLMQRFFARFMFLFFGVAEGDYREWDLIRAWADEIDMMMFTQNSKTHLLMAQ